MSNNLELITNEQKNNLKVIEFKSNNENIEKIESLHLPRWDELPDIDLYLDQLVTLLDRYLSPYFEEKKEPIITKTMINNYVKHDIIEAPVKKKYNRNHIASLFVICILKSIYSINNIASFLDLATSRFKMSYSYNKFCDLFEYAIRCVLMQEKIDFPEKVSDTERLLQSVVQSVAYKIYVEKVFLSKKENEDD